MSHTCSPTKGSILDHLAISMAVICAFHCLITPLLLVVLPIIATTFWVNENFHLWMLLFVIPTTTLAIYSGCRRHKDRAVIILATIGLSVLVAALISERALHHQIAEASNAQSPALMADSAATEANTCSGCASILCADSNDTGEGSAAQQSTGLPWIPILNTLGGMFLVAGHTRNFLLCRRAKCSN